MTDQRFGRLAALFAEAVELPPAQRGAFLDEACRDEPALRREVDDLLVADSGAQAAIVGTIERAAALASLAGDDRPAQGKIGAYDITGELGRGGMGVVYRARRADGAFDKDVAIKVVRSGGCGPEALRRFHDERRILASLDHPNIARLLDAGTTDEGEPFAVIELVEGLPIDRYCDERRLDVRERVALFARVCRAVAHAHGRLVVHRDLKPSNIVVTAGGEPKLLDFGISKLLARDDEATAPQTATGLRPMTPEYASPEQFLGEPLGTASDIYSLGVVLYELLTGRRPFGAAAGTAALERAVLSGGAPRPSQVAGTAAASPASAVVQARRSESRRLRRQLAGDLDNIVLTALAREPQRRYASASAFESDLVRHLEGQPVQARRATTGYRVAKFVRRHRAGVLGTGAVLAALLALAAYHGERLRRERDIATSERDKARRVAELVTGIFELAGPNATGETITARAILDHAAERLPRDLERQPLLLAEMQTVIGGVYERLALYDQARASLESGLALRERHLGPDHPDVAESLCALGSVVHEISGVAAAVPFAERCLAIREHTLAADDPEVGAALFALGTLHAQSRSLTRERELLERALPILERARPRDGRLVGATLNSLGAVYSREIGPEAAYDAWRRAVEAYESATGPDHPDGMEARYNACFGLRSLRRYPEALACAERLAAIAERTLTPDHSATAAVFMLHSHALESADRLEEALRRREQALAAFEGTFGKDDWRVAASRRVIADTLVELGRLDEARRELDRAAAVFRAAGRADSTHGIDLLVSRARLEFEAALAPGGTFEAFRQAAAKAVQARDALPRTTDAERRDTRVLAAQLAAADGDAARVDAECAAALAVKDAWSASNEHDGAQRLLLAWALARAGRPGPAREQADLGVEHFSSSVGLAHRRARAALELYAAAAASAGDAESAARMRAAASGAVSGGR